VLFQKFAGIDVFDIEVNERDPDKLVEIIASLEPTFGGINLEDIKAPECFIVERKLRERMNIPVFHDDQHGTAIIVGAAVLNALEIVGKKIQDVKLATSGAGAAGIACLDMLVALGMKPENILAVDRDGVLYTGRGQMDPDKQRYARDTDKRTLAEIMVSADVFLGLSAGGILSPAMVATMAEKPIILALANPNPEILPADAKAVRPDCIIATGRSDYPNQVNNALCFPYIFRGALDVGATEINEAMKLACVRAIAQLARMEASDLGGAYGGEVPRFGPEYLIPRPFDPRLLTVLAPAVAEAAMASGIALRPIANMTAYREKLAQFVYRTGLLMKPIYDRARKELKRVVYAEGEEETILRAVQTVIDEGLARPILIGRPDVIDTRIQRLGLRMKVGVDFDLTNINDDPRFNDYWQQYHALTERRGVTPAAAKNLLRSRPALIAALMVERGEADAMICGLVGRFHKKLGYLRSVFAFDRGVHGTAAMTGVINDHGVWFFLDTHVQVDPSAEQIAEATLQATYRLKLFGIEPKVALLSHSNYGSHENASAAKMRQAYELIRKRVPKLEIDGEMMADTAWDEGLRRRMFPNTTLSGRPNLFVMPNLDAANITYNMVRVMTDGVAIGPILMGLDQPAYILTPASTPRRVVNMTAIAAVEAQIRKQQRETDAVNRKAMRED
jgi:malate dehydrogenase (oxaloacetate-decarboxylating)(NADP+)